MKIRTPKDIINEGVKYFEDECKKLYKGEKMKIDVTEDECKFTPYNPPTNENIGTFAGMCLAHGIDIDENKGEKNED